MRQILIAWHNFFFGWNDKKSFKEKNKFLWAFCGVNWKMASFFLYSYMKLYGRLGLMPKKNLSGDDDIIVSLTSFPARIDIVWMVIDSMFHQKKMPSRICLYLSKEEFPRHKYSLPARLLKYEMHGLEIYFVENNMRSHKKYLYALRSFKKSRVITIDDDIYYNDNTISNLLDLNKQYPDTICSNTVHVMKFDNDGNFLPYNSWTKRASRQEPSLLNIAVGYNGVLYPPIDYGEEMFDSDKIMSISPKADDLWLKANEVIRGIKVVNGDFFCRGIEFEKSQAVSLSKTNVQRCENDKQWKLLIQEFSLKREDFND